MTSFPKIKAIDSQAQNTKTESKPQYDSSEETALKAVKFLKTGSLPDDQTTSDKSTQNPNATKKPNKK